MHNSTLSSSFPIICLLVLFSFCTRKNDTTEIQPNFLLLMSDNQSWNHLGCYGDPVVHTPEIDKLATMGVRFTNAYCAAPSCTPARAAMLTGQEIWRLDEGANLWGILPSKFQVYTRLLEDAGYLVGMEGKGWGPGNFKDGGWDKNPGGQKYDSFEEFLGKRESGQPFCYWFSSRDPHRPYKSHGNEKDPERLKKVVVPPYLPDNNEVRSDMLDYYSEIENFDKDVGSFITQLEHSGQLDSTLIVVCSDNGWQMPRGLANLYDFGTRIPMIISMPSRFEGERVVDDFISLNDLAPTFLDFAGIQVPEEMTANSLSNLLLSNRSGQVEPARDHVFSARERHAYVRRNGGGFGGRSIRTNNFLYIRNYEPENWPAGDPPLFGDVDAHMLHYPSPTKIFILENRDEAQFENYFRLAFDLRPKEEFYDVKKDPFQMNNVADNDEYADDINVLRKQLDNYLIETKDPRVVGGEMKWIGAKYYAGRDFRPVTSKEARERLGLEKTYSYID